MLLRIAYDGARFAGFARQPTARTIAGELDGAIAELDPRARPVIGLSRTDAGVHARAQLVVFQTNRELPPRAWAHEIGVRLPREIALLAVRRVPATYDPRGAVRSKTYRYTVLESVTRDPFLEGRAWRVPDRLNHPALSREVGALLGRHDFAAFRTRDDERPETVRTILRAEVRTNPCDARLVEILVTGDGFLHRMVRIITGTLVDVARGRLKEGAIAAGLASRDRDDLGMTAPPDGLVLDSVDVDIPPGEEWPDHFRSIDRSDTVT
ncbi:MAG: tRNA pseudouridine(38-40) synthase TruA [Polyangiaceae bacterium]|nr:tRNA pseudouridine(38-40) synthase TruA [Polyangiaceae bacterium]